MTPDQVDGVGWFLALPGNGNTEFEAVDYSDPAGPRIAPPEDPVYRDVEARRDYYRTYALTPAMRREMRAVVPRPAQRAPRESHATPQRRASASSRTSSTDPGDEPPAAEPPGEPLADGLTRIADRLRARGGIG